MARSSTTRTTARQRVRHAAPASGSGALSRLLDELDALSEELAELMLQRSLATIPAYRVLPDETLRQVREVIRSNVGGFIKAMRDKRGPSGAELAFITSSASLRAREGVPLSALLAAYRLGAQVAWGEVVRIVGDEPERMRAALDLATSLMGWVDEVSGAVAEAYLEEFERLWSDREGARRDFLDGAISGALTDEEVRARAEALGLDPDAPFAVTIVSLGDPTEDEAAVRAAQHRVRQLITELPNGDRSLTIARGADIVVVVPASGEGGPEEVAAQLRPLLQPSDPKAPSFRAGVGRTRETLADLAGSYREASIALTAARAGGSQPVAVYGEVLLEELLLRERGVARRLAQTILEPLNPYPDLRATLTEYLTYGPSLPAVARRLFLHPNTVAYRLARVRELTGRDPKTPSGVAELYLALRAAQLVGRDPA